MKNKFTFIIIIPLVCIGFCCQKTYILDGSTFDRKPNIVLILSDDIGYEIPTCNGGLSYQTPTIDSLSSTGIRFTQCHSAALCSPSRFMLMTGKYNFRNYKKGGIMNINSKTIANMLRDAGYKTCVAGKWQLGGGDVSIYALGFDKHIVYAPFEVSGNDTVISRYKNPVLYQDGSYLPTSQTEGRYGEDLIADYAINFIDSLKQTSQPFFLFYSQLLCHAPFGPTPDDAQFATWGPKNQSDVSYFPSMVKYMDKKLGEVLAHLPKNTIVIYVGDNGTPPKINSVFNGKIISGGKGLTIERGTHVPLVVSGTGVRAVNKDMIDFTDFLPTIANAAEIDLPDYGTLDGHSFFQVLKGRKGNPRNWIFCSYPRGKNFINYIQNTRSKEYQTKSRFYHIIKDPEELNFIKETELTPSEKMDKKIFDSVLSMMH